MSNTVLNPHPGATVVLRGIVIPLESDVGGAFISDCCRNKERILNDSQLCERFGISLDDLKTIHANPAVRLAVNAESERRIYNGDAARESAAKVFADAPSILGQILKSEAASPRHRIEAAREIRATAQSGADRTGDAAERVIINIDLGADQKLVFDKQVAPLTVEQAKENLDADG